MRLILVFDRGYARVRLVKDLNRSRQPFLIRGRSKVMVQAEVRGRRQWLSLGRLPHRSGWPTCYRHILYHSREAYLIFRRRRGSAVPGSPRTGTRPN